jgi:hypothetical protein
MGKSWRSKLSEALWAYRMAYKTPIGMTPLSPHLTIGKEHSSIMPTRPTTGILALREVTVRRQLVVPLSSSDDDLPLVKHDARVDLNPGGVRIHYT